MRLVIDGIVVNPQPEHRILDLVRQVGLDAEELSMRPVAAQIAGEVFNLNDIPVCTKEVEEERSSIRRAIEKSNGVIQLLRYRDPRGMEVYTRTAQFVLFLAIHKVYPDATVHRNCTIGSALAVDISEVDNLNISLIKDQFKALVQQDLPFTPKHMTTVYPNCFYGEMLPSAGYLTVWDILPAEGGLLFLYPDNSNPARIATYTHIPQYIQINRESRQWCQLMGCETILDLNAMTRRGKLRELIRVNEALHENRYAQIADEICQRNAKIVLLAGPSASGKTTSAHRLATQLRVHGKKPIRISLDDYYIDRDQIQPDMDGILDLEHINTIDIALFHKQLKSMLLGEKVELPVFDFVSGKRQWYGHIMKTTPSTIIIVEGLHALNPLLLPKEIDNRIVYRFYVSALLPLNLDAYNRIPSNLLRLLRRIIRDYESRGASVASTIGMWDSVRRGEHRWIFPYQETADAIFNSSTLYELAVLKRHIFPLLKTVPPEDTCYELLHTIESILNCVLEGDVDDEIPPTSLMREFIGGSTFYRE